ncbi:receptor activity-modifying protein 1 [Eublepharis macularius]|uniref:Receptor activity-modifying protein 1 n=1 Tax=Eublepharis macularius TaxID=481883 RepID=A0AA97KPM7_EUBMA|nr:receptor activity-modifying protein 1 [Eublepharis macularius]
MAGQARVPLGLFWWLLAAPHVMVASGCHEAAYGNLIQEFCFNQFKSDMGTLRQTLWCDFDKTLGCYREFINCTLLIGTQLDCNWPNKLVDEYFIAIHQHYFKNCPESGWALRDPPNTILCPFIVVPIFITLLMTALVVWRSKHSEGIV